MRMIDQIKGDGEVILNIEIVNQFSIKWMLRNLGQLRPFLVVNLLNP